MRFHIATDGPGGFDHKLFDLSGLVARSRAIIGDSCVVNVVHVVLNCSVGVRAHQQRHQWRHGRCGAVGCRGWLQHMFCDGRISLLSCLTVGGVVWLVCISTSNFGPPVGLQLIYPLGWARVLHRIWNFGVHAGGVLLPGGAPPVLTKTSPRHPRDTFSVFGFNYNLFAPRD